MGHSSSLIFLQPEVLDGLVILNKAKHNPHGLPFMRSKTLKGFIYT